MPEAGTKRYFVEYLDHAQGIKAIKDGGGDPDYDTMWDYCDQSEIEVCRPFPSKKTAVRWANENKELDVFSMPRIREDTFVVRLADEEHFATSGWEQTGYWEMDGTDIVEFE